MILAREYATLDVPRELEFATNNPSLFIENRAHPFGIDEAQLCPPSAKLDKFAERSSMAKPSSFESYLARGGLPGICFFREAQVRRDRFEAHLDTLLLRDLQLVLQTTTTGTQLKNLVRFLVPNEGTVAKAAYVFEDQGVASFCMRSKPFETTDIFRGLYANLRQELIYVRESRGDIFTYKTHDGAWVPLVFKTSAWTVGVIPLDDDQIPRKAVESARSFLSHYTDAKVIYAYAGKTAYAKTGDFRTLAIPYWWLV
ncbi:MAG: hypothetical protein P4M08_08225 [Oligoflexia bacterium]|nr:hypothetical protein [Oligoflexia bacterium]